MNASDESVQAGIDKLVGMIEATPGAFILCSHSEHEGDIREFIRDRMADDE